MPDPCGPKCPGQGSYEVKKAVEDYIRSIFYASSKKKAIEFFDLFKQRWQQDLPSAVKYLDNPIKACLTFFIFPVEKKGLFENYKHH